MTSVDWANHWHLEVNTVTGRWRIRNRYGRVEHGDKTFRSRRAAQRRIDRDVKMMLAFEKRQAAKRATKPDSAAWVSVGDQK